MISNIGCNLRKTNNGRKIQKMTTVFPTIFGIGVASESLTTKVIK